MPNAAEGLRVGNKQTETTTKQAQQKLLSPASSTEDKKGLYLSTAKPQFLMYKVIFIHIPV